MSGALERRSRVPHVTPPSCRRPLVAASVCEPEAGHAAKLFWVDLFLLLSFLLVSGRFVSFLLVSGRFGPPGACPAASDRGAFLIVQLPQSVHQKR